MRVATRLRRGVALTHVPQMFVDYVSGRQSGDESREDQHSRDDHAEIVNLTQAKEKVRNRVDR